MSEEERVFVASATEIDKELQNLFDSLDSERLGLMLSGGMDSACLATYMKGGDAYVFRYMGGDFQQDELEREKICPIQ